MIDARREDLELIAAIHGLNVRGSVIASDISASFRNRQSTIADHIVDGINAKLTDPEWIGSSNNYYISDDNDLRFQFSVRDYMPECKSNELPGLPDKAVTDYLIKFYESKGWNVQYSHHGTMLSLRVTIDPIEIAE